MSGAQKEGDILFSSSAMEAISPRQRASPNPFILSALL